MIALARRLATLPTAGAARRAASDPVIVAVIAVVAALIAIDPRQAAASVRFVAVSLAGIAPFLGLAVAIAGAAKASGADAQIARAFSGRAAVTIPAAALVGALSPFCSCGVIPLIAAMLGAGVPLAPVMAFWISSPIMDPEMFVLTAAGIGPVFAIVKTLAAIAMGGLAGCTVLALERAGVLGDEVTARACCGCRPAFDASAAAPVHWRFWRDPERRALFRAESVRSAIFLGRWLALAFLLESLMVAYVPADWIARLIGGDSPLAIPLAALAGLPAYLNGYAAIPLVAGLLHMGMSPGAAMAFVTAGAVSSIPAAIAVWALVRRRVFFLYLALGLAGAVLSGIAYQAAGGAL